MKITLQGWYEFEVKEGDDIHIEHIKCMSCGGRIGLIKQIRNKVTIKEIGELYCCDWYVGGVWGGKYEKYNNEC